MGKKFIAIISAIAVVGLLFLLQTTAPATIGPLGILTVFILMYVSALGMLTFLLYGVSRLIVKASRTVTLRKPLEAMSLSHAYYFSSAIALAPVILISMQSVGGISFYEFVLVIVFVVIACLYIARRSQ